MSADPMSDRTFATVVCNYTYLAICAVCSTILIGQPRLLTQLLGLAFAVLTLSSEERIKDIYSLLRKIWEWVQGLLASHTKKRTPPPPPEPSTRIR